MGIEGVTVGVAVVAPPGFVTVRRLALMCGASVATAREWLRLGQIPGVERDPATAAYLVPYDAARAFAGRRRRRRESVERRKSPCRHCGRSVVLKARGLCWTCLQSPAVRDLYPPDSPFARKGSGAGRNPGGLPLPPEPTDTPPGSPERASVYAERVAAGVSIWHPLDRVGREPARGGAA